MLRTPPAQTFDNVVFPEGFTIAQIGQRLRNDPRLQQSVVLATTTSGEIRSKYEPPGINSLEGLMFPAKYQIAGNDTEAKIVQRLVTQMEKVGAEVGLDKLPPDQAYNNLIIASMVETRGQDRRGPPEDRPGHPRPRRPRHAAAGRRHAVLRPGPEHAVASS